MSDSVEKQSLEELSAANAELIAENEKLKKTLVDGQQIIAAMRATIVKLSMEAAGVKIEVSPA